jgi:hypothetical protein
MSLNRILVVFTNLSSEPWTNPLIYTKKKAAEKISSAARLSGRQTLSFAPLPHGRFAFSNENIIAKV